VGVPLRRESVPKTREWYAGLYAKHIGPQLGSTPLRNLTIDRITGWHAERVRSGAGKTAVRRSLRLLGGIMQRAVEHGRIPTNPARNVRPVKATPSPEVRPLAPFMVELMRAIVPPRDATLISVLAYAGLRPVEALGTPVGRHPGTHDPRRARRQRRRVRRDEDEGDPHRADARPGGAGSRGVADAVRATG
jgi:integrase